MSERFIVYTKPQCPFCVRAKTLIGDAAEYIDVSANPEARQTLIDRGLKTVPQIYVKETNEHIGGYTDFVEWSKTNI